VIVYLHYDFPLQRRLAVLHLPLIPPPVSSHRLPLASGISEFGTGLSAAPRGIGGAIFADGWPGEKPKGCICRSGL